ncbi:hypothetical protein M2454_000845 [Aequitasia blattaphilus]|uniref:Linear amide C-N hydrolase n=1 Tax=Aequitasia blattaphilus TaxID=2949332 RepID=A0ABT1ECH8_9FIRM|nr:linear amide C-N hydrolase [Aequitasia blattaphilus]MCP1102546.1 linear amide C-N hydrolase [Aequitasia blattaphilus]MCR8615186.1 linear amide C-N hydrolase [Aequitasia blattaphilus]
MKKKKKAIIGVIMVSIMTMGLLAGCKQTKEPEEQKEQRDSEFTNEEYETLSSLKKVTDNYYTMEYKVDYGLDTVLEKGASNLGDLGDDISEQVLNGLPHQAKVPDLGCSAFTAVTPDGDYIQGRNLDIADAQNTLVRTQPKDGYASLSTASGLALGYITSMPDNMLGRQILLAAPYYPADGINEKGLSVAMLLVYGAEPVKQDTGRTAITTSMAIRMLLDKAANVEEAVELMEQYDMYSFANSNIHFQIADAEGNSTIIEYVNGEMQRLDPEEYGQAVTNHYMSKDIEDKYMDGEDRLISLQSDLKKYDGVVTTEQAMEMLEKIQAVDDYDELSGVNYNTSYSIVFNNTKKSVDVCANKDYSKVFSYDVIEK